MRKKIAGITALGAVMSLQLALGPVASPGAFAQEAATQEPESVASENTARTSVSELASATDAASSTEVASTPATTTRNGGHGTVSPSTQPATPVANPTTTSTESTDLGFEGSRTGDDITWTVDIPASAQDVEGYTLEVSRIGRNWGFDEDAIRNHDFGEGVTLVSVDQGKVVLRIDATVAGQSRRVNVPGMAANANASAPKARADLLDINGERTQRKQAEIGGQAPEEPSVSTTEEPTSVPSTPPQPTEPTEPTEPEATTDPTTPETPVVTPPVTPPVTPTASHTASTARTAKTSSPEEPAERNDFPTVRRAVPATAPTAPVPATSAKEAPMVTPVEPAAPEETAAQPSPQTQVSSAQSLKQPQPDSGIAEVHQAREVESNGSQPPIPLTDVALNAVALVVIVGGVVALFRLGK